MIYSVNQQLSFQTDLMMKKSHSSIALRAIRYFPFIKTDSMRNFSILGRFAPVMALAFLLIASPKQLTAQSPCAPIPYVAGTLPTIMDSCGSRILTAPIADACSTTAMDTIYAIPTINTSGGGFSLLLPGSPPRYLFQPGSYTINWVYTEPGNLTTTSQGQSITVVPDTFDPVALCKAAITIPLRASGDTTIVAAQIDSMSFDPGGCNISRTLSKTTFTCSDIGTNLVILTVKDNPQKTDTCHSRVTIVDVSAPKFTGIPNDTMITTCGTIPPVPTVTALDACSGVRPVVFTQTSTQASSGCGKYTYVISRKWKSVDALMNADSITKTITITDDAPSFANIPDTLKFFTGPNRTTCDDTVKFDLPSVIGECIPGVQITTNPPNAFPKVYGRGQFPIEITATDSCGNTTTKNMLLIVRDGTPPQAVCINGISTTVGSGGQAVITQAQINNNSFDNCNSITIDPVTYIFTCAQADGITQHPVSITVRDIAGNLSTCSTYVVVQENVKPVVVCPANITVQCNQSILPANTGTATASDNCPGTVSVPIYMDAVVTGTNGLCATITRTWSAVDARGNVGTCNQIITRQDMVAPVLSMLPPDTVVNCYTKIPVKPVVTATDNCDTNVDIVFTQDTSMRAPSNCGKYNYTITRRWVATDDCGLSTSKQYNITVRDTLKPSFASLPDTIKLNTASFPTQASCTIPYTFDAFPFLSECADSADLNLSNTATLGSSRLKFSGNYPVGTFSVIFTATDPCNNTSQDTVVFVIKDNSTPTVVCETSIDISLGTSGTATIDTSFLNISTSDNCGIATMSLSKYTFTCANLGQNSVTLTAVDINGNTNTCVSNVNVLVGASSVFTANVAGNPASYFGSNTGSATASVSGAGAYTYAWSNMATTANISGLLAGTYTVTITNTVSGCVLVDTAVVAQGPKLKLQVGHVVSPQAQITNIAVTSVTPMINVNTFSFVLNDIDPLVATVNNLVNVNPAIAADLIYTVNGNSVAIAWVNLAGSTLTLPANTQLFQVQVTAGSTANLTTPVRIGASGNTPFEFIQTLPGGPTVVPVDTMHGSIAISAAPSNNLGGLIATWVNPEVATSVARPVAGAIVTVGVPGVMNDTTGTNGIYDIAVPTGVNSLTKPTKFTAGNVGVSSADLLRIINHIFGSTMPSPYQQIAANVNNDAIISLGDYLKIQRVVLATVPHIDADPDWIFIPKSFTLPTTGNWLTVPYPTSIAYNPLLSSHTNDDFVAIRRGDTNGNTPVNAYQADDRYESSDALKLMVDQADLTQGTEVLVPIYSAASDVRQALQGTFVFDSETLEFAGAEAGSVQVVGSDFGQTHLVDGRLTMAWASTQAAFLNPDAPMFTLKFNVKKSGAQLDRVLAFGSQVTKAESYTSKGETTPVTLAFRSQNASETFNLLQSKPNPATQSAEIGFILPTVAEATLRITDINGRIIRTFSNTFAAGYNQVTITKNELGGAGVYFYELTSGNQVARSKMVFIQ
jgi:hypothetical protein